MRVALAQLNPTVGDFGGNLTLIEHALGRAEAAGADLLVSPELGICGYPPVIFCSDPHSSQARGLEHQRPPDPGVAEEPIRAGTGESAGTPARRATNRRRRRRGGAAREMARLKEVGGTMTTNGKKIMATCFAGAMAWHALTHVGLAILRSEEPHRKLGIRMTPARNAAAAGLWATISLLLTR